MVLKNLINPEKFGRGEKMSRPSVGLSANCVGLGERPHVIASTATRSPGAIWDARSAPEGPATGCCWSTNLGIAASAFGLLAMTGNVLVGVRRLIRACGPHPKGRLRRLSARKLASVRTSGPCLPKTKFDL